MEKGQQQETFLNGLLLLLSAGIFFTYTFNLHIRFILPIIIVTLIIAVLLLRRESNFTFIPFCVLFFLLGVMRFQAVNDLPTNDISNFAGEDVYISGTIREQPRIRSNADTTFTVNYIVDVETVRIKDDIHATGGLRLNARYKADNEIPFAQIGDKISAYGNLHRPLNYNNPGQIDNVLMLKCEGITATMSAGKLGVDIEYVEVSLWTKFLRLMASLREHYKNSMREVMPNQDAAAIFAMLFGGYEGLNPELTESFRITGIVHILSVSGSHMSLLAATVAWLCRYFILNRKLKLLIGFIVIGAYTVLSGFVFPVVRSAFMGYLVFITGSSEKYEKNSQRSLILIAMFILMYSPLSLFHISFQLSFLATAGLIYFAPTVRRYLFKLKIPDFISMSLACTISATIFSQPIIAWYFNQISISALLSNIIIIPILEIIIIIGLLGGIVGLIISPLAKVIFLIDSLTLGFAYELNKMIAHMPFSNVYFPTISFAWSIVYYIVLLLFIQNDTRKELILNCCKSNLKLIKLTALILIFFITFKVGMSFNKPPEITVHFIDVHQGDCALVVTPNGHAMMFDTGGVREHKFDVGGRVDVQYLYHYGITHLDYIFLSHAHEDHTAGAGSIIKKITTDHIITAGESKSEYATSMAISETAPELEVMRKAVEGEVFEVDGVKVEVIYAPEVKTDINVTGNEVSNVYKVTFGKASFLFTGDLVKENEQIILNKNKDVRSTLLKVGHHGSKTSSSKNFVEAVKPQYAVFCVGADNTFGHPRPEVVELMESVGAKIYRTDRDGAIVFHTDGNKIYVQTRIN